MFEPSSDDLLRSLSGSAITRNYRMKCPVFCNKINGIQFYRDH